MRNTHHPKTIQKHNKGFLKLNFALWLAIIIMAVAGSVAVYLYNFKNQSQENPAKDDSAKQENAVPIEKVTYSGNIENIANQCKRMVSKENSFVIFEHGTCVRLLEPVTDHAESATSSLKILSSPNIDFIVKPLNNNNYLIVFNDYLLCWLFAKDIANMKEGMLTDHRLAPSDLDSEYVRKLPELERRLGKFARLLLQEDTKTITIKKIIRANISSSPTP